MVKPVRVPSKSASQAPVRERRTSEEVEQLVLSAATQLFSSNGYAGTSTREIAELAGVAESVLYRNYRTKARVFEAAITLPFSSFLESWASKWEARMSGNWTPEALARDFVQSLYNFLITHRELGLALVNAFSFEGDVREEVIGAAFSRTMGRVAKLAREAAAASHLASADMDLNIRLVSGMIFAQALFHDLFFPAGKSKVSRRRIIDGITVIVLYGTVTDHPPIRSAMHPGS
jgi:AcrR family transcriptional regulator